MKPSSKATKYLSGNCILKGSEELGPLVLGDCNSAMDKKIHKEFNIQTVISIGQEAMPMKQKLPENCKHYFYNIHDNKCQKVPSELFEEVSKIIEQSRKTAGVLVHCYAGVSRSSTFVIAYIMQKWNKSYDAAKQQVKSARSCIYPNDGFVNHLKNYDKVLQKREQERLRNLDQQKRREIQKSLVKSSRKSVRGGVKSADMSPQRVKQMEEQRKRYTHQIIMLPIPVIKEQKEQVSEKTIDKKIEIIRSPISNSQRNMRQQNKVNKLQENKANLRQGFSNRSRVGIEKKKQQVKLPKVNNNRRVLQYNKKQVINKSNRTNQNSQVKALIEIDKKNRLIKVSSSFKKTQQLASSIVHNKKQPASHQQHRSVMRESKSVMSSTKYKTTVYEIDESLLNEHEKKIKKIYQTKIVVK